MRREVPALYAAASTVVGVPILAYATMVFIQRAVTLPAAQVYPMAIAAFGVTGALAGICFTAEPLYNGAIASKYAGEKFLHSSLLLIETTILIYAKDAMNELPFVLAHGWLKTSVSLAFGFLVTIVSTAAGWTWYWGFSELNRSLWKSWEVRTDQFNAADKAKAAQKRRVMPNNGLHVDADKAPRL
jgi:hypothetical protein